MTEIGKQPETPIIETVKGRQGKEAVYYPLGPDGKPLVPSNEQSVQAYDEKGGIQPSETKGNLVDTEA